MKKSEIERYKKRESMSWENMFYSTQRIDLLVIAISGAGIYVCLELFKFNIEEKLGIPTWSIKTTGGFMILAIISNFISQVFGYKTNFYDYLMCDSAGKNKKDFEKYDSLSDKFSGLVDVFNWISYISMFIGLILMVIYFIAYF